MPITYTVHDGGHFINARAHGTVSPDEFVEYEIAHAIDERIKPPVSELFEIESGALKDITMDDFARIIEKRKQIKKEPKPHRCAMVVSLSDDHSWNLAKFYEKMVMLHRPEVVIVFGNLQTARTWLGVQSRKPDKHIESDKG
jgi:hypothetical protein